MYDIATQAVRAESKQVRYRELTNQLEDLKSQGFIKNIPQNDGPIKNSMEGALAEYAK